MKQRAKKLAETRLAKYIREVYASTQKEKRKTDFEILVTISSEGTPMVFHGKRSLVLHFHPDPLDRFLSKTFRNNSKER
jgi:hypothetical protein